ncbi:MAG: xanthine dehydrogenase FAD-binding subunit [Paracoccaceae bacterium]|jgi:xanthine dehydrogenase FAD-binding subunit
MDYHIATSFDDAVAVASNACGITRFLAGGTDVLVQLRADIVTPDTLIDIKHIDGVKDISRAADGSWRIGIAVAGAEMTEHAALMADWPGVVEAMDLIGSTQIQGRATLTGNLCNGSPAADGVPAMVAAEMSATVTGPNGTRQVAIEDFLTGPGRSVLTKGDLVTALHIPARGTSAGDAYLRFIPRTEMDIAVVGCAVNLTLDGDIITSTRVSLGAVAPTVLLVEDAANAIIGSTLDDGALEALATAASAACKPINDKRGTIFFRTHVAGVMAKRAAKIAYARAQANTGDQA